MKKVVFLVLLMGVMGRGVFAGFAGFADFEEAFVKQPSKLIAWKEMEKEVGYLVDGIGYRVDLGIRETVIALKLLGFFTIASCEGHLDHGCAYPWVDVALPLSFSTEGLTQQEGNDKALDEFALLVDMLCRFYDVRESDYRCMLGLVHLDVFFAHASVWRVVFKRDPRRKSGLFERVSRGDESLYRFYNSRVFGARWLSFV